MCRQKLKTPTKYFISSLSQPGIYVNPELEVYIAILVMILQIREANNIKGFYTSSGYMGYILGKGYQLFETENAYHEWLLEFSPKDYIYQRR